MLDTLTSLPLPALGDLAAMQAQVYEVNHANGWYEIDRSWGEDTALIHSEISELLEAYRDGGLADLTDPTKGLTSPAGTFLPKPEGVGAEAADVLIRLLDTARRRDLSLRVTPDLARKHGEDVGEWCELMHGDTHALYIARERGERAANMLLMRLLRACAEWGIDLQAEYERKHTFNAARGHRHGGKRL